MYTCTCSLICPCVYRPGDAEVISIDAFVKEPNGLIFGVTLIKVSWTVYSCLSHPRFHWHPSISSREIQILRRYSWTCMESIVTQMHPFNGKRSQVRPQSSHPPASTHCCWTALLFILLSRGLATTELEIHPIPAHTHAVSSCISLCVWSYPSF